MKRTESEELPKATPLKTDGAVVSENDQGIAKMEVTKESHELLESQESDTVINWKDNSCEVETDYGMCWNECWF